MNKNASNAILKILEEPQDGNFIILITHNLEKILPTIKSRCHIVKVKNLSNESLLSLMQQSNINNHLSSLTQAESLFLMEICDGSIGQIINYGVYYVKIYRLFLSAIFNCQINQELINFVAEKSFNFEIIQKIINFFCLQFVKYSFYQKHFQQNGAESGQNKSYYLSHFDEVICFIALAKRINFDSIFTIQQKINQEMEKVDLLHLDKRLCLINIINYIIFFNDRNYQS